MSVTWSRRAQRDLLEIGRYIARHNPKVARAWVARLHRRAESAAEAPLAGRVVPELGAPAFREVIERSYRIIYRVEESSILVLSVLEGHRLLPEIDPEDGR